MGNSFKIATNPSYAEDVYPRELVRYIHLNPVRAGIVTQSSQLNQYRYCGHGSIMGKQDMPWQEVKYVLGYFGKTIKGIEPRVYTFDKMLQYQVE